MAVALSLVVLGCGGRSPSATHRAGGLDLAEIVHRLDRDAIETDRLARDGIYVVLHYREGSCVVVWLANPTEPNRAYLRARYGRGVCPKKQPMSIGIESCSGVQDRVAPEGALTTPDVRGMELYAAEFALVRAGLRYSLSCGRWEGGAPRDAAVRPALYAPERGAVVDEQCPRPGTRLETAAIVALDARSRLPGGYTFAITGVSKPCAD